MVASRRGSKKRSGKKKAIARMRPPRAKAPKRPTTPKARRPKKPTKPRAKARVDTIDLEFTWGGGVEATLMSLLDHELERLTSRPSGRGRITLRYACDSGGVHPLQWDLLAESDMRSPILRGRKNDEPIRTLAQTGDTSRWQGRSTV